MYRNKKILLIIPARGGSKGLPGKNIAKLGGVPLIVHSITAGKNSKLADRILVSTDSPRIGKISQKYGADVPFLRPKEFATDVSPTVDAVIHALDWLDVRSEKYDAVGLLEPTSPLRKPEDIDNAIKILIKNWGRTDAVVSVGKIGLENPALAKKIEKGHIKPIIEFSQKTTGRQNLPAAYFPYGVIYLCKTATLRKEKTFYPKRTMPYHIERWQNYEIDDIYDLVVIQAVMKYQKNKQKMVLGASNEIKIKH